MTVHRRTKEEENTLNEILNVMSIAPTEFGTLGKSQKVIATTGKPFLHQRKK